MERPIKERYISSAMLLILSSVIVKVISAIYKIPLTAYIGSVGRGYFSVAYNLFMPVYAVTMGAFPIALSKLVSKYIAKGDATHAYQLRRGADRLFFLVGVLGIIFVIIFAKPYSCIIASSPKSIYSIIVIMPCALFSSMAASRRAFAEGNMNMVPTAISQILDAFFKMIFGLLFARMSMSYLYSQYLFSGRVLMQTVSNEKQALSLIYPLTSAAAMAGVTVGALLSAIYVMLYVKIRYPYSQYSNLFSHQTTHSAISELWQFSLPLIISTVIQSAATLFDNMGIQYCLTLCDVDKLISRYNSSVILAGVTKNDLCTYLYGLYSSVSDFKNLVPGITMSLGIAAVPAISAAYESSSSRFGELITSVFKYTAILAIGGGAGLALYSGDILSIFYSGSNPDIVTGGNKLLFWFGVSMLPTCLASTAVFSVQALGLARKLILPYSLSAVLRLLCDFIFVRREKINLLGGVISSFAGYLLIMILSMVIIKKNTNADIAYKKVFISPCISGIASYFLTQRLTVSLLGLMNYYLVLVISVLCFVTIFVILLVIMGAIRLSDLKNANIRQ